MTAAVKQLLETFDSLPSAQQKEAAREILQRLNLATGDLPESALLETADQLFLAMDQREAADVDENCRPW
jgi:hypothetical protein